jgi:hypothetical protein
MLRYLTMQWLLCPLGTTVLTQDKKRGFVVLQIHAWLVRTLHPAGCIRFPALSTNSSRWVAIYCHHCRKRHRCGSRVEGESLSSRRAICPNPHHTNQSNTDTSTDASIQFVFKKTRIYHHGFALSEMSILLAASLAYPWDPEYGGIRFLRNVCKLRPDYTA